MGIVVVCWCMSEIGTWSGDPHAHCTLNTSNFLLVNRMVVFMGSQTPRADRASNYLASRLLIAIIAQYSNVSNTRVGSTIFM